MNIVSTRRLLDDFLSVDEAIVEVDGQQQRRLSLERGDAAAAIVRRLDDGLILLTRQFRYPTLERGSGWIVETPAGVVEPDEDPSEAIRREIVEELGYEATHLEPIASFFLSPGGSSERLFLFYAEVDEHGHVGEGGGVSDEGEQIEIVETPLDELVRQLHDGELTDAKTIIGVQWLAARSPQVPPAQ